ncbi:PIN domain-containing protein [Sphingopyxis sp. JAI108]|uniref:type II toxin-antitoxin system VapC family toxin n=1 Tax=Sphingopyxis sp. JAI108 TaxID=2723060 RepID=UPI0015C72C59|nr:PIN domain-containing protein [Sphingopyxis sp. JAI108]NYF31144.1 putative nucleic acid-binding protein [Sphingopyxis sp. JAI108]
MAEKKRVYWDACAWLGLLNGETEKMQALQHVWESARLGHVEIWTSAFCIAEVYKVKCDGQWANGAADSDARIDGLFDADFVKVVQVDIEIARLARSLLRSHDKMKKPSDGIHLATAVHWNLDQLHTYDGNDLLGLIGVKRADGGELDICRPNKLDGDNLFTVADESQHDPA